LKSLVAILFLVMFSNNQTLETIRTNYVEASLSKNNADNFLKLVVSQKESSPVYLAYKGAAISLQSKFTTDKKKRKELFIEGVTLLEKAMKQEPNAIEIRLIRLSIQENTPKLLGYKANIEEDKKFIIANFNQQDAALKKYVSLYVKNSKVFSPQEKNNF
jgi:hypothetical protein